MALDPKKNFININLASGIAAGATSMTLEAGGGALLPNPSVDGNFNLVLYDKSLYYIPKDDPNREIVRVTEIVDDTLTIVRAQEGTSDVNHNTGGSTYAVILSITAKDWTDIIADNIAAAVSYISDRLNIGDILDDIVESIWEQKFTGFTSWSGAGNYWSIAGDNFTLLRGGTGFIRGKKVIFAGSQVVSIPANTCQTIYIDSGGGLQKTLSGLQILDGIALFEVMNDGTIKEVAKENHPYSFPISLSEYAHTIIGSVLEDGGGNITRVATGSGGSADDRRLKIVGDTVINDHGIRTDLDDTAGSAITIKNYYTNASGKWIRNSEQTEALMLYNNAGTPTALGTGKFGVFRIYGMKDNLNSSSPQFVSVMHTAQYNTIGEARAAILSGVAQATNELFCLELVQLGYIIVENNVSGGYIAEVQIEKQVLRSNTTGAGATNLASLISVITATFNGMLSSGDSNVQNALETIDDFLFRAQNDDYKYAADAGSTDAYAITLSPAPSAYVAGQVFYFKANTANTGTATLNVNSLGVKTIKKNYNEDLETGDIVANQLVAVQYDGTNFQLLSRTKELKYIELRCIDQDTDLGADTNVFGDFRVPKAMKVLSVGAYVDTAGTTGVSTIDINEAGTTILSTKITIDSGEKSSETAATPPVISDSNIAADAILTIDIDGVSTTPPKGLVVWLKVLI